MYDFTTSKIRNFLQLSDIFPGVTLEFPGFPNFHREYTFCLPRALWAPGSAPGISLFFQADFPKTAVIFPRKRPPFPCPGRLCTERKKDRSKKAPVLGGYAQGFIRFCRNLFPHKGSIVLEIHPVFLRPLGYFVRKNLSLKTAKHSKARDFPQDKIKNHGKADACRGFLM